MPNKFNIPQINPLKFYHQSDVWNTAKFTYATYGVFNPNYNTRSIDADFFSRNIKSWMDSATYFQPYQRGDKLCLTWTGQDTSITGPYHVRFINCKGKLIKTVAASYDALLPTGDRIWYCNIPLWDIPAGKYYIQLLCQGFLAEKDFFVISEPIDIKDKHDNSLLFEYRSSYNDQGVFYEIDAIKFMYRQMASFTELSPMSKFNVYEDQPMNLQLLSGTPYREWLLSFGVDNNPMPEFIVDKINRILLSDSLVIDGIEYTLTEGSKLEFDRTEKNPLLDVKITLREKVNNQEVIVSELYSVNFGTIPDTPYFYVKEIISSSPSTVAIGRQFSSIEQFLAYLNLVFLASVYDRYNYFSINDKNQLSLTTNNAFLHSLFIASTWTVVYYTTYIEVDVVANAADQITITSASNPVAVDYALFNDDLDAIATIGSNVSLSIINVYGTAQISTTRCYFTSNITNIDIAATNGIAKGIGGILSPQVEFLTADSIGLKHINNNLLLNCNGTLNLLSLTGNSLTVSAVNKIIRLAFEKKDGFDYLSSGIALGGQSPSAPPSKDDIGIVNMINELKSTIGTISTD